MTVTAAALAASSFTSPDKGRDQGWIAARALESPLVAEHARQPHPVLRALRGSAKPRPSQNRI
jgi:hypothetical protein